MSSFVESFKEIIMLLENIHGYLNKDKNYGTMYILHTLIKGNT